MRLVATYVASGYLVKYFNLNNDFYSVEDTKHITMKENIVKNYTGIKFIVSTDCKHQYETISIQTLIFKYHYIVL